MKPKLLTLLVLAIIFTIKGVAQSRYSISLDSSMNLTRSKTSDISTRIFLKSNIGNYKDSTNYKVIVSPDLSRSTLAPNAYTLSMNERPFALLSDRDSSMNIVSLLLHRDSVSDRTRILVLKIEVKNGTTSNPISHNGGLHKEITITVKGIESSLILNLDSIKSFSKDAKEDRVYPLFLSAAIGNYKDSTEYKVKVTVDNAQSTLPASDFKLDFSPRPFNTLNELDSTQNTGYLTIKRDTLEDRTRKLVLKVEIYKGETRIDQSLNLGRKQMVINVKGIEVDSLKAYNYLAYIGTNFDLVDGVKAKNLFFASNIFLPPNKKKSVGMYLSLYGNRTMTSNDTTGNVIRTSRIVGISDTTIKRFTEQASLVRTQVSDNLGAFVSPLVRLWNASNKDNILKLYYAPTLEFVWRRTNISSVFTNPTNIDSVIEPGYAQGTIDYSNSSNSNVNEFVFNIGVLGLMVVHESKQISVRVHGSTGLASTYSPLVNVQTKGSLSGPAETNYEKEYDIFFCGRAWITESVTGLTLQAEITNTLNHPRPFYGVTLSKAINFNNLGKILQPIFPKSQ